MKASEKIEAILSYLGISAAVFANALGYSRPQIIYDILRGKTKGVSDDLASKITSVYPEISRAWLLAGVGQMLNNVVQQSNINGDNTSTITNGSDRELLNELAEQRKLTAAAQELASKAQAQTDRLIAIIEKMQNNQ